MEQANVYPLKTKCKYCFQYDVPTCKETTKYLTLSYDEHYLLFFIQRSGLTFYHTRVRLVHVADVDN